MVTLFIALHDVVEEPQGPTYFISRTHPRPGEGNRWFPPNAALVVERGEEAIWFKLKAGDAVIMAPLT